MPSPLRDYFFEQVLNQRKPASLSVCRDTMHIRGIEGSAATYRLPIDAEGQNVFDVCPYLIGLTDNLDGPHEFDCLSIAPDIPPVDIHIAPIDLEAGSGGFIIVFQLTARPEQSYPQLVTKLNETSLNLEDALRDGDFLPSEKSGLLDLFLGANAFLLEQTNARQFRPLTPPPTWIAKWYPLMAEPDTFDPIQSIPFLEYFLHDAQQYWATQGLTNLPSEVWEESDADGNRQFFTAKALALGTRKLLLIQPAPPEFLEKLDLLQRARRAALEHSALQREILKKEVLLHCIVHDLKNPLTSIVSAFTLLEIEADQENRNTWLQLGREQALRQADMIDQILDAFSSEMRAWDPASDADSPCARNILQRACAALEPSFTLAGIDLRINLPSETAPVIAEADILDRIFGNILENALRHAPPNSVVEVSLEPGDPLKIRVQDQGPGVPPEQHDAIFEQFSQGRNAGSSGLGLFFCRRSLNRWGGGIHYYDPPHTTGAGFVISLKSTGAKPPAKP